MSILASIDPIFALVLVLSVLCMFALHALIYKVSTRKDPVERVNERVEVEERPERVQVRAEQANDEEEGESSDEEGLNEGNTTGPKMMGKKKRLHMERKAAMKEYRKHQLEQSKSKQAEQKRELKELRKAEKANETEKLTEEEAWEKYIEDKRRQEEEEYQRWRGTMTIGESGSGDQDRLHLETQSESIISTIQQERVVILEALSSRFRTSTNLLVELINQLLKERRLEGIFDETGKFLCVSKDDRLKLAKIIQRRGRVDITELTREANLLISLEPTSSHDDSDSTPVASSSSS